MRHTWQRPGVMNLTAIARKLTWLSLAVTIQLAAVACGPSTIATPGAGGTPPTTAGANSPSQSPMPRSSFPPPPDWVSYSDSHYNFSLRLPPNLTVQVEGGGSDSLQSYRAYDPQQVVNGYPRGQIEFAIYTKDANSVRDWVARHTGAPSGPAVTPVIYWETISKFQQTTAAGRDAVYFDAMMGPSATLHTMAFLWKSSYVFRLDWWSNDLSYAPTVESIGRQMIDSFQG
jgi:hypothetical protein